MAVQMIIRSISTDIHLNLAIEEHLLNDTTLATPIFFIWQSQAAVVIGKNQNPWRECLVNKIEENGLTLARRISGGGAVYHDLGNLNCTLINNRRDFHEELLYDLMLNALKDLGITAERKAGNCLMIQDRKFSGHAYCYKKDRVLHHGTILVSADLAKLQHYLTPTALSLTTRSIPSKPAQVMNLNEIIPSLTVDALTDALSHSFAATFHEPATTRLPPTTTLGDKYNSWDWRYGATPDFETTIAVTINKQSCTIRLAVHRGLIKAAEAVAPADLPQSALHALLGQPFKY